jgi:small-conductance mechanosensitive channel/CRP-like cAMP-binding protein
VLLWQAVPVPLLETVSLAPHPGWWGALRHELFVHETAHLASLASLVVLTWAYATLPLEDKHRLRFPALAFLIYLATVPTRAWLSLRGLALDYEWATLGAMLLLSLSVVSSAGVLVFDLLGRRLARMRILRDVAVTAAGAVTVLVMLRRENVNLLSLVTTSAVLTAVIGLAMQDTLGNVINGIAVQLETGISPGDWVQIGDVRGQVAEIRWRSTTVVTRNDELVVVPHSLLARSVIVNSSRPYGRQRRWVYFDVHYRHPPNEVQRVVLGALAGIPDIEPADPAPDCVLMAMEQDHGHWAVRYRLLDLRRDDATDSEVRKRVWYALRRSGIEIPYPSRNLFLTELNKERELSKSERERTQRQASLRGVDLLGPLADAELAHLADRMRAELFADGERVIRQGDEGDSLYLIRRGAVSIEVCVDGCEREVATLREGDFFGEMSLMTGERRHATVVARGDVECYVIDRALFQEVLAQRESLVGEISSVLLTRQRALAGTAAELGAAAARLHCEDHARLVDRVKRLFGLGGHAGSDDGGGASAAEG